MLSAQSWNGDPPPDVTIGLQAGRNNFSTNARLSSGPGCNQCGFTAESVVLRSERQVQGNCAIVRDVADGLVSCPALRPPLMQAARACGSTEGVRTSDFVAKQNMSMITHSALHHHIIRSFVERGSPPKSIELATVLGVPVAQVHSALMALQEYHGVVLHPGSCEIWIAHPFSAAPTNFWIQAESVGCWANCAWCAMGAVTLLGGSGDVTTTIGAESKQVTLRVENGVVEDSDLFVHFPIPMTRAWDNVVYTCSTMLLFESEAQVDDWCERHRIPRGDLQPLSRVLAFAQDWYGRHLDEDWVKWSSAQAAALFRQHGLGGPIWQVAAGSERF